MQRGTPLSLKFTLSKHTLLANALSKFSFWTLNSFSPLSTLKKTRLFIRNKHTLPTATQPHRRIPDALKNSDLQTRVTPSFLNFQSRRNRSISRFFFDKSSLINRSLKKFVNNSFNIILRIYHRIVAQAFKKFPISFIFFQQKGKKKQPLFLHRFIRQNNAIFPPNQLHQIKHPFFLHKFKSSLPPLFTSLRFIYTRSMRVPQSGLSINGGS